MAVVRGTERRSQRPSSNNWRSPPRSRRRTAPPPQWRHGRPGLASMVASHVRRGKESVPAIRSTLSESDRARARSASRRTQVRLDADAGVLQLVMRPNKSSQGMWMATPRSISALGKRTASLGVAERVVEGGSRSQPSWKPITNPNMRPIETAIALA